MPNRTFTIACRSKCIDVAESRGRIEWIQFDPSTKPIDCRDRVSCRRPSDEAIQRTSELSSEQRALMFGPALQLTGSA